jgi:hypothetical protein
MRSRLTSGTAKWVEHGSFRRSAPARRQISTRSKMRSVIRASVDRPDRSRITSRPTACSLANGFLVVEIRGGLGEEEDCSTTVPLDAERTSIRTASRRPSQPMSPGETVVAMAEVRAFFLVTLLRPRCARLRRRGEPFAGMRPRESQFRIGRLEERGCQPRSLKTTRCCSASPRRRAMLLLSWLSCMSELTEDPASSSSPTDAEIHATQIHVRPEGQDRNEEGRCIQKMSMEHSCEKPKSFFTLGGQQKRPARAKAWFQCPRVAVGSFLTRYSTSRSSSTTSRVSNSDAALIPGQPVRCG